MSRGWRSAIWLGAVAFLGWRASACSSNSGGPAPDFAVSVDTPTATTLGTQVVLHVHLTSTGDSGSVVFSVSGADTSWDVALPVGPVTLTANGQKSANVIIAIPSNGVAAPTGHTVTVDAAIGSLHHSAATSVTIANQFIIPLVRGDHFGTLSTDTVHVNVGTTLTFRNDDTLAHIIHTSGAIAGLPHQSTSGGGTIPGGTYNNTISGTGTDWVSCHTHPGVDSVRVSVP